MSELVGVIKKINEAEQITGSFLKLTFILETEDKYPQIYQIEANQKSAALLDHYKVGDKVRVKINIRGREWTNTKTDKVMYFTTLNAWAIEKVGGASIVRPMEDDDPF